MPVARLRQLVLDALQRGARVIELQFKRGRSRPVGLGRRAHARLVVVAVRVGRLVEEREQLEELLLGEGVVFVVVALRAAERRAHPNLHRRVDAVDDGSDAELLVVGPALGVVHRLAVERRRQLLLQGRARQQVSRELLDRELVER